MSDKILRLDFFRFDGEGGGAPGAMSMDGPGTQASAQSQPSEKKTVVYGKSSEGEGGASQVGSDRSKAEDLEAEFAELIGKGGRYHDIYGQKVSETVQNRFKNQQDLQAEMDEISEGLAPLFTNYGIKSGDFEGLKNAIANDDAFYQSGAEKAGLTVEQYKHQLKLQADSDRLQQITESYQREQAMQEQFAQAEADAEELRQAFPNFDLGLEMDNNEGFVQLLQNGVDVKTAFFATHANEIFAGASNEAQQTARRDAVSAIRQRASRPMESAMSYSPAIERRSDPSKLTDEDMDEINRIVSEGGVVSF